MNTEQECAEPSKESFKQRVQKKKLDRERFWQTMQRLIKDDMWYDLSHDERCLFETMNDLKGAFAMAYPELYEQAQHDAIQEMLESAFTVEELEKYWDVPEDLKHG